MSTGPVSSRHVLDAQNNLGRERSAIDGDVYVTTLPVRSLVPSQEHDLGHELEHEGRRDLCSAMESVTFLSLVLF